jgi:hypothetical protein
MTTSLAINSPLRRYMSEKNFQINNRVQAGVVDPGSRAGTNISYGMPFLKARLGTPAAQTLAYCGGREPEDIARSGRVANLSR